MKLLILTVLCAFAAASPALRQKRQTNNCLDAFKNVPNPCVNNPNNSVYFPHPSDSSKFIQCDRYGRMYIIQCPEDLIFAAATSTCRKSGSALTTAPATNAPVATNALASGTTAAPATGIPCTPQALAAGQIYFSVNGDRSSFIECDLLGHPNVLPCPTGLVWDEGRLSCVYDFSTLTGTGTGTGAPVPGTGTGTTTGTGIGTGTVTGSTTNLKADCSPENIAAKKLFFPHPDPTKFIQCDLWGDKFVVSCPAGLVWNSYSETCASAFLQVNGGAGK